MLLLAGLIGLVSSQLAGTMVALGAIAGQIKKRCALSLAGLIGNAYSSIEDTMVVIFNFTVVC